MSGAGVGDTSVGGGDNVRLGLHVTDLELEVWRDRMVNGPYKTAGDVSTNSPGDWDKIVSNADTFKNAGHPYQQWAGQTSASCYNLSSGTPPSRAQGEPMRDAAFYYLLTGDTAYSSPVISDLLAQAAVAGTDFSDSVRWCTASPDDTESAFGITAWLTKLLFAYDYVKDAMSAGNRTTMETWFYDAAVYWEQIIDLLVENAFPDRDSNDYSNPTFASLSIARGGAHSFSKLLYYGGPVNDFWGEFWNNRSANIVRFFTLIGVLVNDATLIARGKLWFKEWIKYNTWSDGTVGEFYRWENSTPSAAQYPGLGWDYSVMVIGPMATIADALARTGDFELYDYSTSTGLVGTEGGSKGLGAILARHADYTDHTVIRYGTDQSGRNGDADYIIDSASPNLNGSGAISWWDDLAFCMPNMYYRNSKNTAAYLRTFSGAPAYPASPTPSGWDLYGGEWGVYPGIMFMFGQMEDNSANPYL